MTNSTTPEQDVFHQIVLLIEQSRNRTFNKINEELILLYYQVGEIVSNKVAEGNWGDQTVNSLVEFIGKKLPRQNGFNRRGLYRMKQFFETYSLQGFMLPLTPLIQSYFNENKNLTIVSAVPTQLMYTTELHQKFILGILTQITWTNHLEILSSTSSSEEKFFYLVQCIKEKWSMRELRRQLSSSYFERTFLAKEFVSALPTQIHHNFLKDPYIFEFLNLPQHHSETDLEKALVLNLQMFILEIGKGFSYMGSQYRLQVGNKDYYSDLLFYHRDLQCLVLFELKVREFEPEFLGKLNFYLEALDRNVKRKHENPSIGILLCKGKDNEVVEYAMARNNSPTLIADYQTQLIDKRVLANKLHEWTEQLSRLHKTDI
ncbi:DUF1016 family protein [Emticicia sp. CRIBPO]|uniref:PDDEXK nuclease domain-containing protein n=1 Tax=Emticicia sp. CRIBPO TaxID=2683258 RepID=UPI001412B380|nr:PDDEXK nuclease domain-containing protein [Emticicia sp. CRIBPO]NBA85085.1 DUF1016 family protein [Emticicia sp. CRIBPO]